MKSPGRIRSKRARLARRDFLKAAGLAAAALGARSAAGAAARDPEGRGRYRESAHVRRVYDLARF